jgi:uncharacterized membrane protein YeiH
MSKQMKVYGKIASDVLLERIQGLLRVTTIYCRLALFAAYLVYTSPPKMESIRSPERLVNLYYTSHTRK